MMTLEKEIPEKGLTTIREARGVLSGEKRACEEGSSG